MAGIGFELKNLFNHRTAAGYLKAYSYSAVVTAGPFAMMTGMVLAIQLMFRYFDVSYLESQVYTASVIYPFVFSNIISSDFIMVITRYLADQLYGKSYRNIYPSIFGMGFLLMLAGSFFAVLFFWNKPLELSLKLYTYVFYMEMLLVWLEGVYLTAVKDYKGILLTYGIGVGISILLALLVLVTGVLAPAKGAMLAMDIGAAYIVMMFLLLIRRFFGCEEGGRNFDFLSYFGQHQRLFFIALFYTTGLYLPNILIWRSELAVWIADTYVYSPAYDVATFYAFLSVVPVMIMFVVSMELSFYKKYAVYFTCITQKGDLREIEDVKQDLLHTMWFELRNIMEFQLVFTLIFLALGNYFLPKAGLAFNSVDMYNLIVLGAYFTGIMQVIYTLLLYFEDQQGVLRIAACFLLSNLLFGGVGLWIGEESFGFTFFLAAALTVVLAVCRVLYFCRRLDYFVFCSRPVFYAEENGVFACIQSWIYKD